jgi:flagellar basal body-associated protein FliL
VLKTIAQLLRGSRGDERGSVLVIAIAVVAIMLVAGTALLSVVLTQTDQTQKQRTGESTFNLAEATLNVQAFLLARDCRRPSMRRPAAHRR